VLKSIAGVLKVGVIMRALLVAVFSLLLVSVRAEEGAVTPGHTLPFVCHLSCPYQCAMRSIQDVRRFLDPDFKPDLSSCERACIEDKLSCTQQQPEQQSQHHDADFEHSEIEQIEKSIKEIPRLPDEQPLDEQPFKVQPFEQLHEHQNSFDDILGLQNKNAPREPGPKIVDPRPPVKPFHGPIR
jgi:hypothetical protein